MSAPELTLVSLSPTADSKLRWADGSLKGIKTFRWQGGEVCSPLHRAVWLEGKLTAREFYTEDGELLRGKGGIHAIWPVGTMDNEAALDELSGYVPGHRTEFTALVSGWGRSVMGDVGWRAEHASIRCIIIPPRYAQMKFRQWCRSNGVKWSVL